MLDKTVGRIFVAGERGYIETDWYRRYCTFNFGSFQNENKVPFGQLLMLNEETLAGQKKLRFTPEQDVCVMLLPTVGAVIMNDDLGNETIVQAGEALYHHISMGASFTIQNPYDNALVNFLHLWFQKPIVTDSQVYKIAFNLDDNRNKLMPLFFPFSRSTYDESAQSFIGKFGGREETSFDLNELRNNVFAYVLEGAFEVQYRLLEKGDGLALWNVSEVEMEALSNNAIILIMNLS